MASGDRSPSTLRAARSIEVNARRRRAFTLIEILTVLAIIGILFSITITAGRGIQERGKINRAKAEMTVLAAALEQYKQHYGDYPWTPTTHTLGVDYDGGAMLLNALCGNLGPKANVLAAKGRTFVELAKFTLSDSSLLPDPELTTPVLNWFNDPWGKWYYYVYKKSDSDAAWKSPSFLLYSHGPDTNCNLGDAQNSGFVSDVPDDDINADNLYHARN